MLVSESTLPRESRGLLRRIFRVGVPQVIILLALFVYIATGIGEGRHIERQWFNLFRTIVVIVALTLLSLWAIFFSGWRKSRVIVVLLLLGGSAVALFRIEYNGDLKPSIHFRDWVLRLVGAHHAKKVRDHRQRQAETLAKRPVDPTPLETDFPGYRGADRTGVVGGPAIARDWNTRPPREIWKQPVFEGYSAFAVVNEFLFTMEQREDNEAVVCYDAVNGNELWSHSWPGKFKESMGGIGPRTTPTVDRGLVFALGAFGRLVCLDAVTGESRWAVETLQGNKNLRWAMSASPLIVGDLVIVNPGSQTPDRAGKALTAYHRLDGSIAWSSGKSQAGYASPMLVQLGGRSQILLFDGAGLGGYDPERGTELWRFPWRTQGSDGINVAQPIVREKVWSPPLALVGVAGGLGSSSIYQHKGEVFIASGYGRGGALLSVQEEGGVWTASEIWTTGRTAMRCKFSSPVEHAGYIYGFDDGNLQCIDLTDGRVKWLDSRRPGEGRGYGHGQILRQDDLLLILTEYGEIALVEAKPDAFHELGRMKVLEGDRTWNNPAFSNGRLYLRNHQEMACYDVR